MLDAKQNAPQVRTALLKMRQQVPDLGVAKSTFFAFTDDKGIAVRNDLEQDTMAGKDLVGAYPDLKKALAGEAYVTTQGRFPGVPNPQGPDKEWVAGVPGEARRRQPHRSPRHRLDLPPLRLPPPGGAEARAPGQAHARRTTRASCRSST